MFKLLTFLGFYTLVLATYATECHNNHGGWGGDCKKVLDQLQGDNSQVYPDGKGRHGVTIGSCSVVVQYYTGKPNGDSLITNSQMGAYAYPIWRDCFQGNEGIYRSGVVYPNGIKICMCNNNSQGSC